jgi:hypothetical protein
MCEITSQRTLSAGVRFHLQTGVSASAFALDDDSRGQPWIHGEHATVLIPRETWVAMGLFSRKVTLLHGRNLQRCSDSGSAAPGRTLRQGIRRVPGRGDTPARRRSAPSEQRHQTLPAFWSAQRRPAARAPTCSRRARLGGVAEVETVMLADPSQTVTGCIFAVRPLSCPALPCRRAFLSQPRLSPASRIVVCTACPAPTSNPATAPDRMAASVTASIHTFTSPSHSRPAFTSAAHARAVVYPAAPGRHAHNRCRHHHFHEPLIQTLGRTRLLSTPAAHPRSLHCRSLTPLRAHRLTLSRRCIPCSSRPPRVSAQRLIAAYGRVFSQHTPSRRTCRP